MFALSGIDCCDKKRARGLLKEKRTKKIYKGPVHYLTG